jgi:hypothetical protein
MKNLFFLTVMLIALSFGTELRAQTKGVFLHKQETMDALGLNKEQQEKVKMLTAESFKEIGKLRKDTSLSEVEKKSKISKVYRNRDAGYKEALTEAQWVKLVEMREAAKKGN